MKKVALIIPYFGQLPEWFDLFLVSAEFNETIDFHLFTDQTPESKKNVFIHKTTYAEYIKRCEQKLGLRLDWKDRYKLCDLKPLLGYIHEKTISKYDFYGYCDIDLVFGNIRKFVTEEILEKHDVFSTHSTYIGGHFALYRNTSHYREKFKHHFNYKHYLSTPDHTTFDESEYSKLHTRAFTGSKMCRQLRLRKRLLRISPGLVNLIEAQMCKRIHLEDLFTSPHFGPHWRHNSDKQPDVWHWKDGTVWNSSDNEESIYYHFVNQKARRYRYDKKEAPWAGLKKLCYCSPEDMRRVGLTISTLGFHKGITPEKRP